MEKEFFTKVKIPVPKFRVYTTVVKDVAKLQIKLDKDFRKNLFQLRVHMYNDKITPRQFWKKYKALLLKSISKNTKKMKELIAKTDKEMDIAFKKAEKEEKKEAKGKEEPLVDLRLPN